MCYPWASWLPRIMFNMNTQYHTTTKETPYKVVFGQMPRHAIVPGAAQHVVQEEDIESFVQPASESSQPPPTESPIPPQQSPPVTPRTWIVEKEKIISWTSHLIALHCHHSLHLLKLLLQLLVLLLLKLLMSFHFQLHQSQLYLLLLQIQSCMISLMNHFQLEKDPYATSIRNQILLRQGMTVQGKKQGTTHLKLQ